MGCESKDYFCNFWVDFAFDPDPGSQKLADPTDSNPKHWGEKVTREKYSIEEVQITIPPKTLEYTEKCIPLSPSLVYFVDNI